MNGAAGTIVRVLIVLVAAWLLWKVALFVIHGLIALAVPVLVIGAGYLILTRTNAGRSLIGGRRSLP